MFPSAVARPVPATPAMRLDERTPYPHRSVRSVQITTGRLMAGVAIATALSSAIAIYASALVMGQANICATLLNLAGVPVSGWQDLSVFGGLARGRAPVTPFLSYAEHPWRVLIVLAATFAALLLIYRFAKIARNFLVFIMALLVVPGVVLSLGGTLELDSVGFTRIWMQFNAIVWLLLPWVSASLFFAVQPSLWRAAFYTLLVQSYGFFWSALRLTFCLAVLHHAGVGLMPLLWFTLGLLGELLYMLVFFSLAVRQACRSEWGERASWQR